VQRTPFIQVERSLAAIIIQSGIDDPSADQIRHGLVLRLGESVNGTELPGRDAYFNLVVFLHAASQTLVMTQGNAIPEALKGLREVAG